MTTRKFPFEVGDVIRFHVFKNEWMDALILDFYIEANGTYGDTFRYKICHLDKERFGSVGIWTEYKNEGPTDNFSLVCSGSLEETPCTSEEKC